MSSCFLEDRVSTCIVNAITMNVPPSCSFPWAFISKHDIVWYGQYGSAVLVVPSPGLLLTPSWFIVIWIKRRKGTMKTWQHWNICLGQKCILDFWVYFWFVTWALANLCVYNGSVAFVLFILPNFSTGTSASVKYLGSAWEDSIYT